MAKLRIVIVGAGAAGLAAAARLVKADNRVTVLEARDRLGGRIHTIRGDWAIPVEAGAEFIHGDDAEFRSLLASAGVAKHDLPQRHWIVSGGRPRLLEFGDAWERVLQQLDRVHNNDRSFADLLAQCCADLSPENRTAASDYVEGFNAADSRLISSAWLKKTETEVGAGSEDEIQLVSGGYDTLVQFLFSSARGAGIQLNACVHAIRWRSGNVEVDFTQGGSPQRAEADCVILTLPLGVWNASPDELGAVTFEPELPEKRAALKKLQMGAVVKVVLKFSNPVWESVGITERGFLHAPGRRFLAWWPLDNSPYLTGWSGGPRAASVSHLPDNEIVEAAVCDLAQALHMGPSELRAHITDAMVFNWQRDPFSRGAYSYAVTDGADAASVLAKPVSNTLFFAGEATETALAATVAGAIKSGNRAAEEIMQRNVAR